MQTQIYPKMRLSLYYKTLLLKIFVFLFFLISPSYLLAETNDIEDEFGSSFSSSEDNTQINSGIYDPLEKVNRLSFSFSLWLDTTLITPVDNVYITVTPKVFRNGVRNAYFNWILEPTNFINNLLQWKFLSAAITISRLFLNTTLGCLGLYDVASTLNLKQVNNDYAYTLNYYHIGKGIYVFIPVLGPYTLDTLFGNLVFGNIAQEVVTIKLFNKSAFNNLNTLQIFGQINNYLDAHKSFIVLISNTPDKYSLVKYTYIQNRNNYFQFLKNHW